MAISVIRLGTPRAEGEGLRIGVVRRPPRGVRKADYPRRGYYDAWLPELAPSAKWVSWALAKPWSRARWAKYARNYRREMKAPDRERLVRLLAELSRYTDFSIGCYCERAERCHRSILRQLLAKQGAKIVR